MDIASAVIQRDMVYWKWAASQGGVYVPVSEKIQPSPFITSMDREITAPSGKRLTLIGPARMIRQIHEMSDSQFGISTRLSALHPIRPGNAPDPWEKEALDALKNGQPEIHSVVESSDASVFRLMLPVFMDKDCVGCHQGYSLGDLYGGMSVSVPLAPLQRTFFKEAVGISVVHGLLWLIGLWGIVLGIKQIRKSDSIIIKAKEELEQLSEHYGMILSAVGEGLLCLTPNGEVTFANPAANKMLDYENMELVGSFCDVVHCKRGSQISQKVNRAAVQQDTRETASKTRWICSPERCPIQKTIGEGKNLYVEEDIFWRTDGTGLPVAYVSAPLKRRGLTESAVIAFRDISQQKKAEEEKERIQRELIQAQKMEAIGVLAGGVAHDFNNILTALYGFIDLCVRDVDPSTKLYERLNYIRMSCDKAASLVKQLMIFSRRQSMDFTPVDLNELVGELIKMLDRLIGEDVAIDVHLAPELWPIHADASGLEQVIMNLAVNARDAMPNGGYLTIKTENILLDEQRCRLMPGARPGRFVLISIKDTGTGIAPDVMEHIFDPFFTTKEKGKGSGLGLSVVYGIINNHKGWIHVESAIGQGSTFEIYLPASTEGGSQQEMSPDDGPTLEELQGSGQRILLVEDDREVRHTAMRLLRNNGYQVFPAPTAEDARRIFGKEGGEFDLVFSDIVLPDGNGIDLIEEFLGQKPGLSILLSSGYSDRRFQWTDMAKKKVLFLQKPYTMFGLLKMVRMGLKS